MTQLLPFFIVLTVGLIFSELFRRLHLPFVIALIVTGVLIGPYVLEIFVPDETINFIAHIGVVFLMFLAGLEIKLTNFRGFSRGLINFTLLNGGLPFLTGVLITILFGYQLLTALIVGVIFLSSSVAVIVPFLERTQLLWSDFGRLVLSGVVVLDILSLLLISIILQAVSPEGLPIMIFLPVLVLAFGLFKWLVPKIRHLISLLLDSTGQPEEELFQKEVRLIFAILLGTVIVFEFLGLHALVAGFFTGLILSGSINSRILKEKIYAIGYGFFIPVFFVSIGAQINLSIFSQTTTVWVLAGTLILGSVLVKFFSGYLAGYLAGFGKLSAVAGAMTIPQLFTTLAVSFTAFERNLIDESLLASLVMLSVLTTFLGPLLADLLLKYSKKP